MPRCHVDTVDGVAVIDEGTGLPDATAVRRAVHGTPARTMDEPGGQPGRTAHSRRAATTGSDEGA